MNYDDIVKKITCGEKIYNLPLRVTYYCRVSTDSELQLNSLDSQLKYYEEYIKSKKNWKFVFGYIEEGVTGVSVNKRTVFKRMIKDAKLNKFDLIITKEVSRFARDLEDSIHYIRELKESGVGVFFENQNLNTFDPNSELILNIMFNLAQDESKKLSSRIKFGHRQAIKKGHVLGSSNITGYKKEDCKLVIVEEEAKFIRKLFELYATGNYGFYKLAKKMAYLGYYNKNGKIYDKESLKRMITNPKYKGYYRGHTHEIMDYRTKRRKKICKDDQIIYKCDDNRIPAIVTEELWEKANSIINSRTQSYQKNNYWSGGLKYALSSKVYCKEHNTSFQRSNSGKSKGRATWICRMYLNYRLQACSSPIIAEKDFFNILKKIMDIVIFNKNIIIDNMVDLYKKIDIDNKYDDDINNIEKNIKKIENKKAMVLDLVFNGELKKEQLKVQFEIYAQELKRLNKNKANILKKLEKEKRNNKKEIIDFIKEEINGGCLLEFIRKFVDEIIVSKLDGDRNNIKLDIFLNIKGKDKMKTRGASHINGPLKGDILYLNNQSCDTIEKVKKNKKHNKFIYNVYVEML